MSDRAAEEVEAEPNEDLLELAEQYLALSRRWRGFGQSLSMEEARRLSALMRRLECALAEARGDERDIAAERRVALRVPTYVEVRYDAGTCTIGGGIVEISEEGAFIRTTRPPQPGARVRLELIPESRDESTHFVAEVVWVRSVADDRGPAGMGVRFEDVTPEQCRGLIELMGDALVARLESLKE